MVLISVAFIVAMRWLVLPQVKAGRYSVFSFFYLRKWTVALATEITLEVLTSLFATVYMRAWYRLMGAKIGKDAEISTNLAGRYDLVEIGEKCFIADEVVLGDEEIRDGWMRLSRVRTGARVFVGNDAVVPIGSDIPEGALIGIKSKPPANELMKPGDTWFGTPPIRCRCASASTAAVPTGPTRRRAGRSWRAPVRGRPHLVADDVVHRNRHMVGRMARPRGPRRALLAGRGALRRGVGARLGRDDPGRDRDQMGHDGPLRPGDEADVVLVGDEDRGRGRDVLGSRRTSPARASAGHPVPALGVAPVRCQVRSRRLHEHDGHHGVRLRGGRRFRVHQLAGRRSRPISTRTA